jgi:hypothetical protein
MGEQEDKRPTHVLFLRERDGERRGAVGVGWEFPDGTVSVSLNPGVVLSWRDPVYLHVRRVEERGPWTQSGPASQKDREGRRGDDAMEEDAGLLHLRPPYEQGRVCGAAEGEATSGLGVFFQTPRAERCPRCARWARENPPRKVHLANPARPERPWVCDTARVSPKSLTTRPEEVTCRSCQAVVSSRAGRVGPPSGTSVALDPATGSRAVGDVHAVGSSPAHGPGDVGVSSGSSE